MARHLDPEKVRRDTAARVRQAVLGDPPPPCTVCGRNYPPSIHDTMSLASDSAPHVYQAAERAYASHQQAGEPSTDLDRTKAAKQRAEQAEAALRALLDGRVFETAAYSIVHLEIEREVLNDAARALAGAAADEVAK